MVEQLLLIACAVRDASDSKATEEDPTGESASDTDPTYTGDSETGDTVDTVDSLDSAETTESDDSGDTTIDTCSPDTDASAQEELSIEEVAAGKVLGESRSDGGNGYRDYFRVAAAGDVDGDGDQDLVAGCASCDVGGSFGKAWLLLGPFAGTNSVTAARAEFRTPEDTSLGYSVASAGDTTGDGTDDLLLAEKFYRVDPDLSGRVLLVTDPPSGILEAGPAAAASFVGAEVSGYGAGTGEEAGGGNFDGDGYQDIFVSAPTHAGRGAVYAVSGPFAGEYLLASDATFVFDDLATPRATANLGDHDGDGIDDLGIADPYHASIYVFDGPLSGTVGVADADSTFLSPGEESIADGRGLLRSAGDINADGHPDAIVGSPYLPDDDGDEVGGAYVVTGPFAPTVELADAHATLLRRSDYTALQVDGPGDLDGDGWDDIVLGSAEWGFEDPQPGRVFVTMGPVCGTIDLVTEATYTLIGSDFANAGEVVDHADFDADGHPDLLITGPEDTEGGGYAGAAWIVSGFDER